MDVGAVALKKPVRLDGQENIKVARRSTPQAGLALGGKPDTGAVLDPLGDVDGQLLFLVDPALAGAGAAWVLDHLAATCAGGTRALDGEEPRLGAHPAVAAAGAASCQCGAAGRASALAGRARHRRRHADISLFALECLFEGDFHVETQIGTLAGGPRAPLGPMITEIAEHFIEDICKSRSETAAESTWTTTSPPCPGGGVFESGVAETVVGGPFLVVF